MVAARDQGRAAGRGRRARELGKVLTIDEGGAGGARCTRGRRAWPWPPESVPIEAGEHELDGERHRELPPDRLTVRCTPATSAWADRRIRRVASSAVTDPMQDSLEELRQRKDEAYQAGSPRAVERQHAKGKMLARERIEFLLDPGQLPGAGPAGPPPGACRRPRGAAVHRRRDHRLGHDRGPQRLRLQPGLHRLRRRARRGLRREDPQAHGPGPEGRRARSSGSTTAPVPASRRASSRWPATAASSTATCCPRASSRRSA